MWGFLLSIAPEKVTSNLTAILIGVTYQKRYIVSRPTLSLLLTVLLEFAPTCGPGETRTVFPQRLKAVRALSPSPILKTSSLVKKNKRH